MMKADYYVLELNLTVFIKRNERLLKNCELKKIF